MKINEYNILNKKYTDLINKKDDNLSISKNYNFSIINNDNYNDNDEININSEVISRNESNIYFSFKDGHSIIKPAINNIKKEYFLNNVKNGNEIKDINTDIFL